MYYKPRKEHNLTTVITIANQKGGIWKTSTATALASILNSKGLKTLLIDADPQGNSTDTYRGISKDKPTLFDVILDLEDPLPANEAIQKTESGDIIASDPLLKEADIKFPSDGEEYFRLKDALENLTGYDYVVIDTAPADNKLLKNCLVASDYVVIPVTPDRYAIQGLSELSHTISTQQKRNNKNLLIAGLLMIRYKSRQTLSKEVESTLQRISEQMHTTVFDSKVRDSTMVQKAQAARVPLISYASASPVADDYRSFTNELLEKINKLKKEEH